MVPGAGIEPARPEGRQILSLLRLPISPPGQGGDFFHLLTISKWRREPESNRPTWICNPVHNRFAIAPSHTAKFVCCAVNKKPRKNRGFLKWSGKRDSNSRPQPWQGCALPAELFPRKLVDVFLVLTSAGFWLYEHSLYCALPGQQ
jgi:hypothetical protein